MHLKLSSFPTTSRAFRPFPGHGADLRLLQKTMGHASITVTAHIYADLYDDELDDVASALDALDDRQVHER